MACEWRVVVRRLSAEIAPETDAEKNDFQSFKSCNGGSFVFVKVSASDSKVFADPRSR